MEIFWVIAGMTFLAIITPWILKLVFPHKIDLSEILLSMGISILISTVCLVIITVSLPHSTEIWNGVVTDKKRVKVSCTHSYQCNCYDSCTGTGTSRTCTRICQTCYYHSYDVDWRVYSNITNYITIDRLDSRGLNKPPRWDRVIIGEPFSYPNRYIDYLKTSDHSLFTKRVIEQNEEYNDNIPEYPKVYDYYRSKHILSTHGIFSDSVLTKWNDKLRQKLGSWGPEHQINILVILTSYEKDFAEYLKNKWNNGKKNDAIIVLNIDRNYNIKWSEIFSWSKNEYFNSIIRSELNSIETFNIDDFLESMDKHVEHFERTPMEEYKYLLNERKYSWWQILILLVLQLAGNGILGYTISTRKVFA